MSYSIEVAVIEDSTVEGACRSFAVAVIQAETDETILAEQTWGTDLASGLLRAETAIRLDLQALDRERSGG